MVFSFGFTSGWATINSAELKSDNSTFPTGKLSLAEGSLMMSFSYAGSLAGNFLILPISQFFGIKRTIHLFGLPLIVRNH